MLHTLHHRSILYLLIFVFFLAAGSDLQSADWKLVKPSSGKKVRLKIADKSRTYWELEHKDAIRVKITGPSTLKVITRGVLEKSKKDVLYGFIAHLDGKERYFIGRGSSYSKSARNEKFKGQRISESRTVELDVPQGEHEYSFLLPSEVKKPVYARFLVPDNSEDSITYIAFLPRSFTDEVRIAIKEREYIYYRSTSEDVVELEVIGPTRIRGVARLEFDHTIRGDKPYRIQVKESGKVVLTRPVTAQVSGTAVYMTPSNKVLARGESFYIDVPEGKHRFEVYTPDPGLSVIFRFYIPQRDLGNIDLGKDKAHANLFSAFKNGQEG